MKNVRFVKPWRQYQRGERASFFEEIARQLLAGDDPVAVDPNVMRPLAARALPDVEGGEGAQDSGGASDDDAASERATPPNVPATKPAASSGEPPVQGKRK